MRDPSEKVVVAYLHPGVIESAFHESLISLLLYDVALHKRIVHGGGWLAQQAGANLSGPRNTVVRQFLAFGGAEWIFMVDSDMTFDPDVVERLLEHADPVKAPIVSALCFVFDEKGEVQPTLYGLDGDEDDPTHIGVIRYHEWPPEAMFHVAATGTGCLLVHKTVFERMAAAELPGRGGRKGFNEAFPWFQELEHDGRPVGEDIAFCWRAGIIDIPVYVNTTVQCGHVKKRVLNMEAYFLARGLLSPPMLAPQAPEPPWTVPRYAVIPTHNRPARLLTLVESLGAQCDRIVVLDNASTPPVDEKHLQSSVPAHCTVEVIRDEEQPPNLSRFWNVMFDRCAEIYGDTPMAEARHRPDCSLVTTHHLTCTCGAFGRHWDVAVLNDDSVVPAGWYNTVATALREHETAVVAHTGDRPIPVPDLLDSFPFDRSRRMAPHAFVVRGEAGLRSDESMAWFAFDDDFSRQAIQAGGVLAVPGPVVVNSQANQSTMRSPALQEQAQKDMETFAAKWGGTP